MLELTDARSGRPVPVGGRVTRLLVEPAGDPSTAARGWVVADVVRRILGLRGARVLMTAASGTEARGAGVDAAALSAMNVPMPEHIGPDDPRPNVVVTARSDPDVDTACVALVAGVRGNDTGGSADPLATRLALLEPRYRDAVDLTTAVLEASAARLSAMRASVAAWAERPSAAPPRDVVDRFVATIQDDLDVAGALRTLDDCAADDGVADGAKFELFAYADRVLALDLASDVGRAGQSPGAIAPNSV